MFCSNCGSSIPDNAAFCGVCGTRTGSPAATTTSTPNVPVYTGAQPVMDYATWSTRVIGYIVDHILVAIAMGIIWLVTGGLITGLFGSVSSDLAGGACCMFIVLFPLATLIVGVYNRVYLVSKRGFSIGQGVVKIKVVDANGNLLTQSTALIRLLAEVAFNAVPFLPLIDLLWPLWDDRRQTLHDKAVGCYVINNPSGL